MARWQLNTAPTQEPITLAQAKLHLRIDTADEDPLISDCITAAREDIEGRYELALLTQTWTMFLDAFPGLQVTPFASIWTLGFNAPIDIEKAPLQAVNSITFFDTTGTPNVISAANYIVDTVSFVGRVGPTFQSTWPNTALQPINGVQIQVKLGFGDLPNSVPHRATQAMKLLIGHYYQNREQVLLEQRIREIDLPRGVDALMSSLNWRQFVA